MKLAVIGCGKWGQNYIRTCKTLGLLGAIADIHTELTAHLAAQYHTTALDFEAILADKTITGVIIATPANTHFSLARQALFANKHVLVEKPITLEVAEAESLCKLAYDHKLSLIVGHLLQHHYGFKTLKDLVQQKALGTLQYIYAHRLNLGRFRQHEAVHWDVAPHDISMILSLIGEVPLSIEAKGYDYTCSNIHDIVMAHLHFSNTINAHIFASWLNPIKEQKLVVIGNKSMAIFSDTEADFSKKLCLIHNHTAWDNNQPLANDAEREYIPIAEHQPLQEQILHFIDCIKHQKISFTSGEEGTKVIKILKLIDQSIYHSKKMDYAANSITSHIVNL